MNDRDTCRPLDYIYDQSHHDDQVLVEKMGCPDSSVNNINLQTPKRRVAEAFGAYWTSGCARLAVLEFSRDRKSMSVLCREVGFSFFDPSQWYISGGCQTKHSIRQRCS